MKLLTLKLNYFRQHRASQIDCPNGLTGIIGPNGAGKTTILEAIIFALFGSRSIRGKVEDLTTRGYKQRQTSVELRFEHQQVIYTLIRSLDDASLQKGGEAERLAVGTRAVNELTVQILGMNHEEFTNTYFTEQKGLEFLSGQRGASERSRFIVKMMGYDKLERAQELIRKDRAETRTRHKTLQASLRDLDQLDSQIAQETSRCTRLNQELETADRALKSAEQAGALSAKDHTSLDNARNEYEKLNTLIKTLQVERRIYSDRQRVLTEQKLNKQQTLVQLREQVSQIAELAAQQYSTLEKCEQQLRQLNEQLLELSQHWKSAQAESTAEMNMLRRQVEQVKIRQSHLSDLKQSGECPTCGQVLGDAFNKVADDLASEQKQLNVHFSTLQEAHAKLTERPAKLQALEQAHKECLGHKAELVNLQQTHTHSLQIKHDLQQLTVELLELSNNLQNLDTKLLEHNQQLKRLDFDPQAYRLKVEAHLSTERLVNVARLQRQKVESELEKHKALLARSQQDLLSLKQQYASLEQIKQELLILDESDQVLTALRDQLNDGLRPRMGELASEFILDLTDGRYSAVEIGEDFTATVIEDGLPKPVISGGEQDILNLCVRLALSHMLAERAGSEINLLVLDEVFGSLDEQRRGNVLGLLEKLKSRFEQILIITHLDDIKDAVENYISVEYDDGAALIHTEQYTLADQLDEINI